MPTMVELTRRQLQAARLAAKGYTYPQIAAEMNISTSGVRQHIAAVKTKLNVTRKAQIAVALHKEGLL